MNLKVIVVAASEHIENLTINCVNQRRLRDKLLILVMR